jgi:hypothetical protein
MVGFFAGRSSRIDFRLSDLPPLRFWIVLSAPAHHFSANYEAIKWQGLKGKVTEEPTCLGLHRRQESQ